MEKNENKIGCGKDTQAYHLPNGDEKVYYKCGEKTEGYDTFLCGDCHKAERALNKKVEDRTEEDHLLLAKHFNGVRNYLLSMGQFKEDKIKLPLELGKEECPDCFYQIRENGMLEIIFENESILIGSPGGNRFDNLKKAIEQSLKLKKQKE